jgi:hypothetical protein
MVDTTPGSADAIRGLRILEYRRQDKSQQVKDREAARPTDNPSRQGSGNGGKGGKGRGMGKGAARGGSYYGSADSSNAAGRPNARRNPGSDVLRIAN